MKTKKLLKIFFLVSLFGCSTTPEQPFSAKFNADWKFLREKPEYEAMACLYQKDVLLLRELLIKCEARNKK